MISCEQAQNLFDTYLNGELSPSLTAELDAHRLECAACRHQLTLLEACVNVVHLDTSEPEVSADFTDRLVAILEEDNRSKGWLQLNRTMKVTGALLGVAAAIALLVVFYPIGGSDDSREMAVSAPSAAQPEVAGAKTNHVQTIRSSELITGLPIDSIFKASDSLNSAVELGQFGVNHLRDSNDPDQISFEDYLPPFNTQSEPKPDVIETLPELDDGGELM